jgi:hypothetical protein
MLKLEMDYCDNMWQNAEGDPECDLKVTCCDGIVYCQSKMVVHVFTAFRCEENPAKETQLILQESVSVFLLLLELVYMGGVDAYIIYV